MCYAHLLHIQCNDKFQLYMSRKRYHVLNVVVSIANKGSQMHHNSLAVLLAKNLTAIKCTYNRERCFQGAYYFLPLTTTFMTERRLQVITSSTVFMKCGVKSYSVGQEHWILKSNLNFPYPIKYAILNF